MFRELFRRLPWALPFLIAAGLAACGGDDDSAATPTVRQSNATQSAGGTAASGATAGQANQPTTAGGSSAKVEAALKDPCSLLTTQELSAAIGVTVDIKPDMGPIQTTGIGRIAKCQWLSPTSPGYSISVQVFVLNDTNAMAGLVNDINVQARDDKAAVTQAQGIGERALIAVGDRSPITHPARALAISNKVAIRIEVGVTDPLKVTVAAMTTLDKAAAGRVF